MTRRCLSFWTEIEAAAQAASDGASKTTVEEVWLFTRRRHRGSESDQPLAGLLSKWNGNPSRKSTGFEQPLAVHQHWHIDVSYLNINGTFYYLCSILDGFSRYIVNWDLRESMSEADIEIILEHAKELHPEAKPRIISGNGPQFIAKDFKEFIRISGMTHVRT
jgi:putative transposase